jgi:hypothetical protein
MRRRTGPSAIQVAASAPAVRLGLELALKLHQAPDPRAVGTDVRLDVDGQLGSTQLAESQWHLEQGVVETRWL